MGGVGRNGFAVRLSPFGPNLLRSFVASRFDPLRGLDQRHSQQQHQRENA